MTPTTFAGLSESTMIADLETHDAMYTWGYEYGYVKAQAESRTSFEHPFLAEHIDLLTGVLERAGARVGTTKLERNRFGVDFVSMRVRFERSRREIMRHWLDVMMFRRDIRRLRHKMPGIVDQGWPSHKLHP